MERMWHENENYVSFSQSRDLPAPILSILYGITCRAAMGPKNSPNASEEVQEKQLEENKKSKQVSN